MHITSNYNLLWQIIEQSFKQNIGKLCLSYKDQKITYEGLLEQVEIVSSALKIQEINFFSNNCKNPIFFIILQLSGIKMGISSFLFLYKSTQIVVLNDSEISTILTANNKETESVQFQNTSDYSFFFNSSGTTGLPHLVENSSLSFAIALNAIKFYPPMREYLEQYNKFLLCCPLFHSFGFSTILEMLIFGNHILLPDSFKIIDVMKAINFQRDNIDSIIASPFIVDKTIQIIGGYFLKNLQHIGMGTDKIYNSLLSSIFANNKHILVSNRYGCTEFPSAIYVLNLTREKVMVEEFSYIAPPLSIYQYEILEHDSGSTELGIKSLLETQIMRTGDSVIKKNDKLYLNGRLKGFIKYNGIRINTSSIEEILLSSPFIEDCLLYLTDHKLVLEYTQSKYSGDNKKQIRDFWNKSISTEYQPDVIKLVDKIYRTITGKKIRR